MKLFISIGIIGIVIVVILIAVLSGGGKPSQQEVNAPSPTLTADKKDADIFKILTTNLDTPWGIDFIPSEVANVPYDSIIITERPGRVRLIASDGRLQYNPVAVIPQVKEIGEGGLLGIAVHPNFIGNHYVYLYYTYAVEVNRIKYDIFNRVVRMTYKKNRLINEKTIVDGIPGSANHNGGRIKFGPDGYLYITTGDAENKELAMDTDSLAGKILRVTDEGQPAPGNPFGNLVYSYGHRNPQGLAWDMFRNLWSTEHGRTNPSGYDEINFIQPGGNYGWPDFEGDQTDQGVIAPVLQSGPDKTWAPAGAVFIGSSLFFGGLKGETLYEAIIKDGKVDRLKEHFKGKFGRIRDVVADSTGMLYITTSNQDGRGTPEPDDDKLIRINPRKL